MDENQEQGPGTAVSDNDLLDAAKTVLDMNFRGTHTVPSGSMYPHQWLWDSCFHAIGIRHYDVDRAQAEILHLFNGQWANGMVPNIVFNESFRSRHTDIWRSWVNPNSPDNVYTSGITQPPMIAEAVVRIGERLSKAERRSWYMAIYPGLLAYHQWLYRERDPHSEGLVLLIHPWETGLDNTPPWMSEMQDHQMALWIRAVNMFKLGWFFNLFRKDTKFVPAEQRMDIIDGMGLYSTQRRLRRKNYDIKRILSHSLFTIEDITYNSILIRANHHLRDIAKFLRKDLPDDLRLSMKKSESTLEALWDPYSSQYYSREFVSHRLIKVPSIGTLMPLYAGTITKERAKQLVKLLEDEHQFGPNYPVPTVPLNSDWFVANRYWQGPTWVNTNWMLIDGLERYGFQEHADALREVTLELVRNAGFNEYFSPLDGRPAGAENFSWTAALTIDMLLKNKR
jgi:hypothetical protein